MARYYFEIRAGGNYPIYDRHAPNPYRVGTLHDIIVAERVVALLNDYENRRYGH